MAIKIRCSDCRKKISIDEAFAGSMCRCPYCKAIVLVSDKTDPLGRGGRPDAPSDRPAEPGKAPAAVEAVAAEEIPTADPVRFQGIVTIILLGLLVVMVAAAVVLFVRLMSTGSNQEPFDEPAETQVNPFVPSTAEPVVAGVSMAPPIVYVLDTSSSMLELFDFAVAMTRISIRSLEAGQEYSIVLAAARSNKVMPGGYIGGGESGEAVAKEFLANIRRLGASDISQALSVALEQKPKTIVLYARKPVDDAIKVARQANSAGVKIITVTLDGDAHARQSMANLAKATGAKSQAYSFSRLQSEIQDAPPLE